MKYKQQGLYTIKDEYFERFRNEYFMDNKQENRPYYYAVKSDNGIIWMIPISSKIDKYKAKIKKDERRYKSCIFYHIVRMKRREHAFLIGNIFPITEKYIKSEFTIKQKHFILETDKIVKDINTKTKRYLSMVRVGKLKPYVDILEIEKQLLSEK